MGPEPDLNDPTPGMSIWGWMSPAELRWLGEQAATMDSVVEIGSLRGRSSFALLTACKGPVHCVDPWSDAGWSAFSDACDHFPNLIKHRTTSPEVATSIGEVDMVFLDGDHQYESVLLDIEAWYPRTRKLLCGHDYGTGDESDSFPGVRRAVDFKFGDTITVAPHTSIWTVTLS